MILPVIKKDARLLWPMVALVAAIQGALEWAVFRTGLFAEDPAAGALLRPLTLAWYVGIAALCAAIVHQDPIPGVDQDWLVRPLRRGHLLTAKLVFAVLAVCVPMLIVNVTDAVAMRFPLGASLEAALAKELYVVLCLVIPVMAIAALTRNMTELVILGAALVVTFSVCVSAGALLEGAAWCPTCNSGTAWISHLLQHAGVLAGSAALLGVQYLRRRTALARGLCLAGTALFVFVQLPWSGAFALQQRLTAGPSLANGVELSVAVAAQAPAKGDEERPALPSRDVNQAVDYLRRRARLEDAPVTLEVPLRIEGTADDELLLADRTVLELLDARGQRTFRADTSGVIASLLTPYPGTKSGAGTAVAPQVLDVPGRALRGAARAERVRLSYSLTLMKVAATHRLAASHGELESPDAGRCGVANDRHSLYLRCKILTQKPFCLSAVLTTASGERNPEVLRCTPDYRRRVPSFTDVLGFYGIDLPLAERNGNAYPVDASKLREAQIVLRIYAERAHFTRSVEAPARSLAFWKAPE